jgi:hypothetical protein
VPFYLRISARCAVLSGRIPLRIAAFGSKPDSNSDLLRSRRGVWEDCNTSRKSVMRRTMGLKRIASSLQ